MRYWKHPSWLVVFFDSSNQCMIYVQFSCDGEKQKLFFRERDESLLKMSSKDLLYQEQRKNCCGEKLYRTIKFYYPRSGLELLKEGFYTAAPVGFKEATVFIEKETLKRLPSISALCI